MSRRALSSLLPALRARASLNTAAVAPRAARSFASSTRALSGGHEAESYESFTERYTAFFSSVEDLFELQRGLNNCFAYDLVPAPGVIEAALRAARRVDDYSTAVRIFEGVKEKVENKAQYDAYVKELEGVKSELGPFRSIIYSKTHNSHTRQQASRRKRSSTAYKTPRLPPSTTYVRHFSPFLHTYHFVLIRSSTCSYDVVNSLCSMNHTHNHKAHYYTPSSLIDCPD